MSDAPAGAHLPEHFARVGGLLARALLTAGGPLPALMNAACWLPPLLGSISYGLAGTTFIPEGYSPMVAGIGLLFISGSEALMDWGVTVAATAGWLVFSRISNG